MTRPRRRHYLTDRDVARIRKLALSLPLEGDAPPPPILDDLDAPIRVGVCRPGEAAATGAQVAIPWRGRVILGWRLSTRAREARRRQGRYG
jgi:hypothetical protein